MLSFEPILQTDPCIWHGNLQLETVISQYKVLSLLWKTLLMPGDLVLSARRVRRVTLLEETC